MRPFYVRWQNYRGFTDSNWVAIRPLTVLIGPNNNGKSSFISPLLLLKQTLAARDPDVGLVTRGDLTNVGSYRDLITNHRSENRLTFGIMFADPARVRRGGRKPNPSLATAARFSFSPSSDGRTVVLERFEALNAQGRRLVARGRLKTGRYSMLGLADRPGRPPNDPEALMTALRAERPDHFLFSLRGVLPSALSKAVRASPNATPEQLELLLPDAALRYTRWITEINRATRSLLDGITYVGPLREPPQRFYRLSGETPRGVGTRGEFAPELLYREGLGGGRGATARKWMRRFEFGSSLKFEPFGADAFSVSVTRGAENPEVNIADTGFGISQVLPLIVHSLGKSSGLLITEQPEIHLNPRLQACVASLFGEMIANGGGVLVETHSEHLLLSLRRLIAERRIAPSDVAIYYVEKRGRKSTIREIPVAAGGRIEPKEWPAGFFEDGLRESLRLARAQRA